MSPVVPGAARMAVTSFASLIVIVPALLTSWLLSSVIPVPLVRVIDPAELMTMSSADPFATVDVLTEVVVDVPIVVAAVALASVSATSAGAMAVQASRCRMMSPLRPAPDFYARVQEGRCRIGISV